VTLTSRDRRALIGLAAAGCVLALLVMLPNNSAPTAQGTSMTPAQLRQRVTLLRQTAAALPVREALLKQADADLDDRERGIIQAASAAEAQAQLVLTAQRVGKTNSLEVRSSDFTPPKVFGDYGIVYATISFDCHIEQLLNFLADLTREQELIVPSEQRITSSANSKDKMMAVRIVLAGIVAKKLIPEKKGLGAF
jgi:hypothetical protein